MDYRSFETQGTATQSFGPWWMEKDDKRRGEALVHAANVVAQAQSDRSQSNIKHARLYGNFDLIGFGPRQYARSSGARGSFLAMNLIAALCDTVTNKVGKTRPRPSFQTFGGDWKLQRKALKLDKYTQGIFYETRFYEEMKRQLRDSTKFGTGILYNYIDPDTMRICSERVLPDEMLVDDADGVHGRPRQIFRQVPRARELVLDLYGDTEEKRNAIKNAPRVDEEAPALDQIGDMVLVRAGWHLKSGSQAKDGKWALAINGALLDEGEWNKPWHPFVALRYIERDVGYWGQGIAERQAGNQVEINRVLGDISEILRAYKPKMLVPREAKITKSHIRGGFEAIKDIIEFSGPVPPSIWSAMGAVPPEYFAQLERLWKKGFEAEGVSFLNATGEKPAGLNSAPAQREYTDINSERFATFGQDYEQVPLDCAKMFIEYARDIATGEVKGKKRGYKVVVALKKSIAPVEWSDIDLEEDQYRMQSFPVSSLPVTPAARREEVDEWIRRGWIPPEEGPRLMNMPDLEETSSLLSAAVDDVDAAIDEILDGNEAEPPDPIFENLDLRIGRGMSAYLRAKRQNAPPPVLKQLRLYVTAAIEVKAQTAAQAQPGMPAPAGGASAPAPQQSALPSQQAPVMLPGPGPGVVQ